MQYVVTNIPNNNITAVQGVKVPTLITSFIITLTWTTIHLNSGNYDEVTTQLYQGCFVVVVHVVYIIVVVLIFVAVYIGFNYCQ